MELFSLIALVIVVYVAGDLYRRHHAQSRRFRVVLFLIEATHKTLVETAGVSREAIYEAQKKTLYSMSKNDMEKTRKDLAKEGITIEK